MIKADIIQSTVRIWPPTPSFQFSSRESLPNSCFRERGQSPGQGGEPTGSGGAELTSDPSLPPSLSRVYRAILFVDQVEGGRRLQF